MCMLNDVQLGTTQLRGVGGRAQIIAADQAAVGEGRMFKHHKSYTISAGATKRFLLVVPSGVVVYIARMKFTNSDGPVTARLYEGTTASANGTAVAVFNANRTSATSPQSALYAAPTLSCNGTELEEHRIPGSNNEEGAGFLGEDYWVIGAGIYQLAIEYTGATSSIVCVQFAWVE